MNTTATTATAAPFIPTAAKPAKAPKAPKMDRLDKAIALVEAGAVTHVGRGAWCVQASDGSFYGVVAVTVEGRTEYECGQCLDSIHRVGPTECKHALATALFVNTGR